MEPERDFLSAAESSPNVQQAVREFVISMEQGYLRGKFFQVVADGTCPESVKAFLGGPFAQMRAPFSRWLATVIARFPDHAETEAFAYNLRDEFGEEPGRPSHAALYRRLIDELGVQVEEGKVSTPAISSSEAARAVKESCERVVASESLAYLAGFFAGFEATDGPDFTRLGVAVRQIWPDRPDLHEFFHTHAISDHDIKFVANLNPLFLQQKPEFLRGMDDFLKLWTKFYEQATQEVGLN